MVQPCAEFYAESVSLNQETQDDSKGQILPEVCIGSFLIIRTLADKTARAPHAHAHVPHTTHACTRTLPHAHTAPGKNGASIGNFPSRLFCTQLLCCSPHCRFALARPFPPAFVPPLCVQYLFARECSLPHVVIFCFLTDFARVTFSSLFFTSLLFAVSFRFCHYYGRFSCSQSSTLATLPRHSSP